MAISNLLYLTLENSCGVVPKPSYTSKMKWMRSRSPPLNVPCGTRLLTSQAWPASQA